MAFFAGEAQRGQVVVQCNSGAGQDPLLARLLFAAIPSIFALGIAWLAFHWSSREARKQWVRDQKKAEWGDLLRAAAEVQRVLRVVSTPLNERAKQIAENLKPAVHELSVAGANCIFLQEFFGDQQKREKFYSFLRDADVAAEFVSGMLASLRWPESTQKEKADAAMKIIERTGEITDKYLDFNEWLRKEAGADLR